VKIGKPRKVIEIDPAEEPVPVELPDPEPAEEPQPADPVRIPG
jgi:hypothetical protein